MLSSAYLRAAPFRRLVSRQTSLPFSSSASKPRLVLPSQKLTTKPFSKVGTSAIRSASFATDAEASSEQANQNFAAIATGGIPYHGIPEINDPHEKRAWQLQHMSVAFNVFARMGFTEGAAGHISVRDPVDPSTLWINPMGVHFALLRAKHMVQINEEGQVIGGNRKAVNAAGFTIHAAIHKARPDIHAVCHAHSKFGKAWSTFGKPLEMLNQDACIFYKDHSVYSNFGGVVFEGDEGARIAEALGPKNRSVILQNHGLLTAGGTVDEAAYLFTLMERTCEIQLLVESAGLPKQIIGDEEAEYTYRYNADPVTLYTEFQPEYFYELLKRADHPPKSPNYLKNSKYSKFSRLSKSPGSSESQS